MKLTITRDDLNQVKEKHATSDAAVGYVEQWKLFAIPLPKYYVAIVDEMNLMLVQMDFKFNEKATTIVPLESIQRIKIPGILVKKVVIRTNTDVIKLAVKPLALVIGKEQKNLLKRLSEIE